MYKNNKYILIFLIILIILVFIIINNLLYNKYNKYNKLNLFIEPYNNNEGIIFFCQGWTDIFNCMGLINYYSHKYSKLYILTLSDLNKIFIIYKILL